MKELINIRNITSGYEKFEIKNINLNINKGEFLGIIGPNGSGKTTLLKTITRIIKPKGGEIYLDGKNICEFDIKALSKKIAVVSQQIETKNISVEEFVLMGRIPYFTNLQFFESKNDIDIANKSMKLTDVLSLKDKNIDNISGGEKQLACLAKALTQGTELLFLDEPTNYLDIRHQIKILDIIRKLKDDFGYTIIMIIHDLNLAGEYCDRLVLLNKGKIHKTGTPGQVLTYKNIEQVYKTIVIVRKNPVSLKPNIILVSEKYLDSKKKEFIK